MVWRFEPPPGWPPPPSGFVPPKGWRPDPSWPAAPKDWTFWIWDATDTVPPPPRPPSQTPSTATVQDRVPGPPPTPSEMPDQAMVQDRVTRVDTVTETGSEHPSWRVRRQERHAAKEHTQEVAVWQADQDFADEVAGRGARVAAGLDNTARATPENRREARSGRRPPTRSSLASNKATTSASQQGSVCMSPRVSTTGSAG